MIREIDPEQPILVVDDEKSILDGIRGIFSSAGIFNVLFCPDSRDAANILEKNKISLVLLDLTMPHISGQELLTLIRARHPQIPVIIITGLNEVAMAVDCMRQGAMDYLVKAVDNTTLLAAVRRALQIVSLREENELLKKTLLSGALRNPEVFSSFFTACPRMLAVFRYVETIAPTGRTILITGETGTGKELLAEAIHLLSGRPGTLVKVNVAGLDETMFSDTLFGHRKGSFSGAVDNRKGLVETAGQGTLFLDETGDLSQQNQIKLLRLLESGEYYPLGSDVPKRASCRIITATNRDFAELSASGNFRPDLFYRLTAAAITLPPLRERQEDIIPLADFFAGKACEEFGRPPVELGAGVAEYLQNLPFKGNVRELKSLMFDAVSRTEGSLLSLSVFGLQEPGGSVISGREVAVSITFGPVLPTLKHSADLLVAEALSRTGGNISRAAKMLGISQPALSKRLHRGDGV